MKRGALWLLLAALLAVPARALEPAAGAMLLATRDLGDPRFRGSIVLLVAYGARGAMGLIVNRPLDVPLSRAVPGVSPEQARGMRLHYGGPVATGRLLVLGRGAERDAAASEVLDGVSFTASRRLLDAWLEAGLAPDRLRAYAGHAGWGAGQLDAELARGDWVVVPGDAEVVFAEADPWPALIEGYRPPGRWVDTGRSQRLAGIGLR